MEVVIIHVHNEWLSNDNNSAKDAAWHECLMQSARIMGAF